MKTYSLMVPRTDRKDESKTYWDPIGKLFEKDGKMWGQVHFGGISFQVFEDTKKRTRGDDIGIPNGNGKRTRTGGDCGTDRCVIAKLRRIQRGQRWNSRDCPDATQFVGEDPYLMD